MLLVDPRIGSRDLLTPLQMQGVPAEMSPTDMVAADFAFIGRGPDDEDVYVGVELKETSDLVACLYSGRFTSEQLPKLQRLYAHVWLLTEGAWRAGDHGMLEYWKNNHYQQVTTGPRAIKAKDLEAWILTQTILGGFHYFHAQTRMDTIHFLAVLYHWWTDREFDEHRSHRAIFIAPPGRALVVEPTPFHKQMSCLPSIGYEKGAALELFAAGDWDRLMLATVKDLMSIDGIGKTLASGIHAFLHPSVPR